MPSTILYNFGSKGVNVDASDLHMDDAEVRQAQNAIHDPLGAEGGLRNRPGLSAFNDTAAAGAVLGGVGVPLLNQTSGVNFLFIGRGPTS
jgi:hypothetical protein